MQQREQQLCRCGVERTLLGHLAGRRGPVDEHRQVEDFDPGEGAFGGDGRHAAGRSCTVLTGSVEAPAARSRPGGQAADCVAIVSSLLLLIKKIYKATLL